MNCNFEEYSERSCGCNSCMKLVCALVSVLGGLLFAAAVVLLFVNGLLPQASAFAAAALVSSLVYLALLIGAAVFTCGSGCRDCIRCYLAGSFIGIFGTVFTSAAAVSLTLTVGEILPAVVLGLAAFFFAFMIISAFFVVKCMTD